MKLGLQSKLSRLPLPLIQYYMVLDIYCFIICKIEMLLGL